MNNVITVNSCYSHGLILSKQLTENRVINIETPYLRIVIGTPLLLKRLNLNRKHCKTYP